jgi:RNA polymerase sigma-70 factor, ECF subfamily
MIPQETGAANVHAPQVGSGRQYDEVEFEALVRSHGRRLTAYCRRMAGPTGPAEDLAQEVFVKMYLAWSSLDPERPVTAFLFRIAHNHCLDWLRKRRVPTVSLALPDDEEADGRERDPVDAGATPEQLVLREELEASVDRALAAVPEVYRSVLVMRHQAELAYEEIASALGVPIGTVKARLHRGRARLQQELGGIV